MKKYRIIFLGTPEFSLPSLQALIDDARFEVCAVITEPDRPAGRGKILTPPPVKILANKYNIPVFQPEKLSVISSQLSVLKPDVAVVVAYGQIIPKEILDIPKFGFVNIHPSLLPKYRGSTPIQSAILNGDAKTGVSLIKIDEKMDHGPILAQQELKLSIINYQLSILSKKLAELGAQLLLNNLTKYLEGKITPRSQDHKKATFTKMLKKSDGQINWQEPAEIIERKIRAYNPWPGCFTYLDKKRLKILKAHLKGNKLVFDEVQMEGKKPLKWQDFKRGHKSALDFDGKVVV
ncbi:MAG: methionyl-tRNA formyltransferase [Patescibacteria group bacterium]|nr:methionyl-tRNA formyltransferase [Patescibacteria group bacterium]